MDALCPICMGEINFQGTISNCPHCGSHVDEMDLLADEEFACDSCNASMDWAQRRCDYCHIAYDTDYWNEMARWMNQTWQDELVDISFEEIVQEQSDKYWDNEDPIKEISEISWLHNLCCDAHMDECQCDLPVTWEETYEVPPDVREEAYVYDSTCSSCQWFYTPACLSYRSWMIDWLETGEPPGQIDICSFYLLDPVCTANQIGTRR